MALGLGIVKSWDKELDMFPQRERKGGGLRFLHKADRWGLGGQGVINRNDELTPVIFASIPSFWEQHPDFVRGPPLDSQFMWLSLADLTWPELGQWTLCLWCSLVGRHKAFKDPEFIHPSSRPQQDCPWVPATRNAGTPESWPVSAVLSASP